MTWRRISKFSLLTLFLRCSPGFAQLDNCTGIPSGINDGWCDSSNNNPSCNYDGGDCCGCTCVDGPLFACGSNGYNCKDPVCIDSDVLSSYPQCTGNLMLRGDGICDGVNNNLDCGYDGGDCCICTCNDRCSMTVGNDCLDPSAGDELYGCEAPPLTVLPCPSDVQRTWVVDGSAKAQAFAEEVNCSGGEFSVEWNGDIVISKTIYIMGGTILNVTGAASGAIMDGGSFNRLFTVINASLHVTNLSLRFGSAIVGGAIAASASQLTLNNVSFIGNEATGLGAVGGAVFVANSSNVNVNGKSSIFSSNTAVKDGGALYVSENSVVSFGGLRTYFFNNTAGNNGGALAVRTGSHISWDGEAILYENKCEGFGGAVDVSAYSSTVWRGITSFFNNTAGGAAGALMIRYSSCVEMYGDTAFTQNNATLFGGTVFVVLDSCFSLSGGTIFAENYGTTYGALIVDTNSTALWSGQMTFVGNSVESYGGALAVERGSNASWSGPTTFTGNHAFNGGALFVSQQSSVSWTGQTTFIDNTADWYGGALAVIYGSNASWNGSTTFTANYAYRGAALYVFQHTSVSWSGPTTFTGNHANGGGALYAYGDCSIFWCGRTAFLTNHAEFGGALDVINKSSVSWSGDTTFAHNTADSFGGALNIYKSSTWWNGPTEFFNNSIIGSNGSSGAISAFHSSVRWTSPTIFSENRAAFGGAFRAIHSNISWSGETEFNSNRAEGVDGASSAGAIAIWETNMEWSGKTLFFNNSANGNAGMMFISGDSDVCWRGETSFIENRALYGGGVIYIIGSNMSWSGRSEFFNNSGIFGGAISISNRSSASWSGETVFFGNTAQYGGGLWISDDVVVHWTGITKFVANKADFEGGVVKSIAGSGDELSALVVAGPTLFSNNTSGANGGALSIFSGMSLMLETTEVVFLGNSAQVSGGAVFLSGADVGPTFLGVRFESNSAQIGGAVYATSSGNNKINVNGVETQNPTVFNSCTFVDNIAGATGGAVQTAAGHDIFFNTSFLGNKAGVGGALRLAGTAEMESCLFEDNVSDEGGGPAVSNIGYISSMVGNLFLGNEHACPSGTYLNYNESNDLYEVICDGCDTPCQECSFDEPAVVPICKNAMDHSVSPGGLTTLEGLSIDRRYWRATNVSLEILECYNPDACLGGLSGSANYCLEGYEGPYCAICSNGYTASIGFTCEDCSNNIGGIVLAIFLFLVSLVVAVAVVWYLRLDAAERENHGLAQRIMRYIPLQSLKIIIVVWQILTQFASVANVTYPDVYQRFLDGINVLNFDLAWVLSAGCIVDFDFHDRLLLSTIGPILVTAMLAVTYIIMLRRNHESERDLERARHRHLSALLFLTFLVYSSVSSILFQTFACEHLDDGKYYLRADYRIECDSDKHEALQIYAGFMVVMYSLGIPALYAALLFKDRDTLKKDEVIRSKDNSIHTTSSLWKPYKPSVFYYEVIECGRRILLTGVVVFIYPNTAAQIAITLILAFAFALISEGLHPYVSIWDTWISRAGHIVVFVSIYIALLLKVDVSGERAESQRIFEVVLVSVHGCLIAAVLVEALVLAKRVTVDEEGSEFPMRRKDAINWNKTSPIEEVDCSSAADDQMVQSTVSGTREHKV